MLKFKEPPLPVEPKIYFISLIAQNPALNNMRDVLIWNAAVAAFNVDLAHSQAVAKLKEQNPNLYQNGQNLGGWRLQNQIELTVVRIDEELTRAYELRDEHERQKELQELNELMQAIIDTASRKLLEKYKDRFSVAELAYMEAEIEKYERKK